MFHVILWHLQILFVVAFLPVEPSAPRRWRWVSCEWKGAPRNRCSRHENYLKSALESDSDEFEFLLDVDDELFDDAEDADFVELLSDDEDPDESFLSLKNDSIPVVSVDKILSGNLGSQPLSSNVSYFYLKNELCLPEETMWRITYEAGSALGMTASTIRRKVDVLRETMNLSDDDIRAILKSQPAILHLSADKNISPTILFLVRRLDLGKEDLRSLVLACPAVISYSRENLNSKINFFTRLMGYSVQECRDLLLAEPNLIRAGVRTGLIPKMCFLDRELQISNSTTVREIVWKHPRMLLYSLEDNLIPKLIFFLIMTLHMTPQQVQKLLLVYPEFLGYNLERHILPMTQYFLTELELNSLEFQKIFLKFPRIVTFSLQKIKYVVGYLRYEVGLNAEQVRRVLYQSPQIMGLDTENNLKKKVNFLQISFNLTDEQLRTVVAGMPSLLYLSLEKNLQPKLDYLRSVFVEDEANLRDTVLRLPTLLGYSLENRIRPRMQAILQAGLDPSSITVGIPMKHEPFEGWLHRRSYKEKRKREQGALGDYAMTPITDSFVPQDPSGRVAHWTRERRPRS